MIISCLTQYTFNLSTIDSFSMNSVSDKANDPKGRTEQLIKVFWLTVALDKVLQSDYSELLDQSGRLEKTEPDHPRFIYKARAKNTVKFVSNIASDVTNKFQRIIDIKGNVNHDLLKIINNFSFRINKFLGENDDCIAKSHKYFEQTPNTYVGGEFDERLLRKRILELLDQLTLGDDLIANSEFMEIAQGELSNFRTNLCSKTHYGVAIWFFGYNAIKVIEEVATRSLDIEEFSTNAKKLDTVEKISLETSDRYQNVIRNRAQILYVANHLIHFLNICVGEAERHNLGPLLDEIADADLLKVLRQIRDELQLIRQILSEQNSSPETCENVVQSAKRIDLFLDEAAKKAGSATGNSIYVVLAAATISVLELSGVPVVNAVKKIHDLIP